MTTKYDLNQIVLLPFYVSVINVETDRNDPNCMDINYMLEPTFRYECFTKTGLKMNENQLNKIEEEEA